MITSISLKEHEYVLEADRVNPREQQTIFNIVPKTVKGAVETVAAYTKASIEKRKLGRKEIDIKAWNAADIAEWTRSVVRIRNFIITPDCPGPTDDTTSYDHFFLKVDAKPETYRKQEDGSIIIVDTSDIEDIKAIMWSMSTADQEEVMAAAADYNELRGGLKNS